MSAFLLYFPAHRAVQILTKRTSLTMNRAPMVLHKTSNGRSGGVLTFFGTSLTMHLDMRFDYFKRLLEGSQGNVI